MESTTQPLQSDILTVKKNPLRLNKLQLRTLALAQVLASDEKFSTTNEDDGSVQILSMPKPHGNHLHAGEFIISAKEASGLSNPSVWLVLQRKGLVSEQTPLTVTLTSDGIGYDTGLGERFLKRSDH